MWGKLKALWEKADDFLAHFRLPQSMALISILGLLLIRAAPFSVAGYPANITDRVVVVTAVTKLTMQATVTVMVLAGSLYALLSGKYAEAEKKWAYGAVGTILGYWLRG